MYIDMVKTKIIGITPRIANSTAKRTVKSDSSGNDGKVFEYNHYDFIIIEW